MAVTNELHERLTRERQRLKLTQAALAVATGVSTPTVVGYEQGHRSPPTSFTVQLQALGFDVHYVMYGQPAPDFAADVLDWELVGWITVEIFRWCRANGLDLKPEKFGEVLRILYNESRRSTDGPVEVGRVLKLVA